MALTCNVGGADKTTRFVLGIVLLAVGLFAGLSSTWTIAAYAAAAIALLTAFVGYCPLNTLLGIDTCAQEPSTP
ncbi:MAG: DUF2892 domain-containing protein [Bacteroidetes bacterium]|jgi:hypothetical protein|nr:DUF2892 domain-containing protein [Bacteroidota bacterium]